MLKATSIRVRTVDKWEDTTLEMEFDALLDLFEELLDRK